jgi:polyhydroxybutyrate depolymerase
MARRFLVACALVVGCSSADPSPLPGDNADTGSAPVDTGTAPVDSATAALNTPGKHPHTLTSAGLKREFIVYVPEKARDATSPVVFMLHGTSGDGEKFYNISRWKEKADAEGLIAVFPSALTHCFHEDENRDGDFDDPGELKITTKWSAGSLGDADRMPMCTDAELAKLPADKRTLVDHPIADDMAFVRSMLDFLNANYRVDAKRIYATGFSNGAQMTSRLAVEMSDKFAAIAAHAGPMAVEPKPGARPITIVFSLGNIDDRFTTTPIPLAESTAATPMFNRITGSYLATAQLASTYAYDQPKAVVARWSYTTSMIGAKNRFYAVLIENLGHQYPNGTNHPMVMADALWEVFKTESLP